MAKMFVDASCHTSAVALSLGTVVMIITLLFFPIRLPAELSLQAAQSITNALVTLFAAALTALYNHCFTSARFATRLYQYVLIV